MSADYGLQSHLQNTFAILARLLFDWMAGIVVWPRDYQTLLRKFGKNEVLNVKGYDCRKAAKEQILDGAKSLIHSITHLIIHLLIHQTFVSSYCMGHCGYNKIQPLSISSFQPGKRDTEVKRHLQNVCFRIRYDRCMYLHWEHQRRAMWMVDKLK